MNSEARLNSFRVFGCLLVGMFILLASCGLPSGAVSSVTYFPTNATDATASYKVICGAGGEPGRAYSHFGNKEVCIEFYRKNALTTRKFYTIKGADLNWKMGWDELTALQIRFYERKGATDILCTLAFRIDPSTGQVNELEKGETAHHD